MVKGFTEWRGPEHEGGRQVLSEGKNPVSQANGCKERQRNIKIQTFSSRWEVIECLKTQNYPIFYYEGRVKDPQDEKDMNSESFMRQSLRPKGKDIMSGNTPRQKDS